MAPSNRFRSSGKKLRLSARRLKKKGRYLREWRDRLKQQQEAASSNPTDDSSAGPSNIKPPHVMKESKMFVNVAFFVKSLQNLNNHGGDGCNFSDMYISGETISGWNVGIELSCNMCLTTAVVWMQDPRPEKPLPPAPPTSAGATKEKEAETSETALSTDGELLKEQEKGKTKKSTNQKIISQIISQVPAKKRRVDKRTTPSPLPNPPAQPHLILPPSLVRPLHVPQSNSIHQEWTGNPSYSTNPHILVPQSNSIQQNLMESPSNSINSNFINHVPFIKQEVGAPEYAARPFLNRIPLSSAQPVAVQLLFSVENSNDIPLSVDENDTLTPEVTPTEVLPVDLNLVKAEIESDSQSEEANIFPSVRIVPMSETSVNRLENEFVSESVTETSKDSKLVTKRSVMAITKTCTIESGDKLSASVSDILGAKDSTESSYPASDIPPTVIEQVIPGSKKGVVILTADDSTVSSYPASAIPQAITQQVTPGSKENILRRTADDTTVSSYPASDISQKQVIPGSKEDVLRHTADFPSNNNVFNLDSNVKS